MLCAMHAVRLLLCAMHAVRLLLCAMHAVRYACCAPAALVILPFSAPLPSRCSLSLSLPSRCFRSIPPLPSRCSHAAICPAPSLRLLCVCWSRVSPSSRPELLSASLRAASCLRQCCFEPALVLCSLHKSCPSVPPMQCAFWDRAALVFLPVLCPFCAPSCPCIAFVMLQSACACARTVWAAPTRPLGGLC
jgi:hypothetical protein